MKDASPDGWKDFLRLCAKIKSPEDFEQFFNLFLTIEEKETMASRYLIVKALMDEDLTQREIAEIHHVSISQITRGSNALKIVDKKMKNFLQKQISSL